MPNNTSYSFTISSATDFNNALASIDTGGMYAGTRNTYTFTITAGFTLDRQLDAINLQGGTGGGSVLDIASTTGSKFTIDGGGAYNGLFVYAGTVNVSNLTIADTVAKGGAGGSGISGGGGGGAGLGGGLFVAGTGNIDGSGNSLTTGGNVTLTNVSFSGSSAVGGKGGAYSRSGAGIGGGGLEGGTGNVGGGGVGLGANNGYGAGGAGIILGAAAGGTQPGTSTFGGGSATGGANGGAGGNNAGGGVGGKGGYAPRPGGFGGGGGQDGRGGFGGGGGYSQAGGFGGGGGSYSSVVGTGAGGFGAGNGGGRGAYGGGGGLGAGADVFVQAGGVLTIAGAGSLGAGTVTGGAAGGGSAGAGKGLGSGIFIQGTNTVTLAPGAGATTTVSGVVTDQVANGGTGAGSLAIGSATTTGGSVVLAPVVAATGAATVNTFTGGTTVADAATVSVAADSALGATSGGLTLNGGTLEVSADGFSSARGVTLGTGGGTAQIDTGTATLSGIIASAGGGNLTPLTKTGAGTLVLSGANTFTGNVTIDQGNLSVSNDGNLGAPNRFLVIAGGTLETNADGFSSTRNFTFDNVGTIQVDTGTATLTGVLTGGNAQGVGTGGLIKTGAGTLTLHNGFNNSDYSLGTKIEAGALDLYGSNDAGTGAITFAPAAASSTALDLETSAQKIGSTFTNTLTNFNAAGETLDLKGFAFDTANSFYVSNGSSLTVMGGTNGTQSETFALSNGALLYSAKSDGAGGTEIQAVTCFASGTVIGCARGGVKVEHLAVGDRVVTAAGAARTIRWIGHRAIWVKGHPRPQDVMPIRVAAHAFGASLPARDLFLSPGHPVLVGADSDGEGGHLVPIMCLINGTTIERIVVESVTYWHVELDEHDILLAEGLPAESYIDLGSRPWFAGADGALYDPDMAAPGMPGRCRPVAIDGPVVEAERRRLDGVFAMRLAGASAWPGMQNALLALF